MKHNRGFTLIELLVVMAISLILMGLVLAPVIQSFKMTRRAQAMVDAQDAARHAMEQISRELGQAMYVYDNAAAPVDIPVNEDGVTEWFPLHYAKIDFVLPRITMHCNAPEGSDTSRREHPAAEPRDYPRGLEAWPSCPVCNSPDVEARPKLPLEQDVTVVRYFLGLADNKLTTENLGWVSPWEGNVITGTENQVVLYRVEFSPYDDELFPVGMPVEQRLADPRFFYRDGDNGSGQTYAERWADISRVVGIGKYEDLVVAKNKGGMIAAIEPTITFRTVAVDNDTFVGAYSSDKSFETPDAVPTLYRGAYGYWTPDYRVTLYRDDPATAEQDPYEVAYSTEMLGDDLVIYKWTQDGSGNWVQTLEFNISQYQRTGNISSPTSGHAVEMAFTVDPNRGTVNFALVPPKSNGAMAVSELDPDAINVAFHSAYAVDRGSARRYEILSTFDPAQPNYLKNARIVPGSEQVVGPDMTPGSDPIRVIRYERVPLQLGDPGLNQYKIDYDTGEIFFSMVPKQDLPVTNPVTKICVDYKVRFNLANDVVKGEYCTKSLVNIHMGMRMFDPESGKPHPVDLTKSVKVRNALR